MKSTTGWTRERDYFQGHSHCTNFDSHVSAFLEVQASVFQGSAIGPASYVITAADLSTLHTENKLLKYADDAYLTLSSPVMQNGYTSKCSRPY